MRHLLTLLAEIIPISALDPWAHMTVLHDEYRVLNLLGSYTSRRSQMLGLDQIIEENKKVAEGKSPFWRAEDWRADDLVPEYKPVPPALQRAPLAQPAGMQDVHLTYSVLWVLWHEETRAHHGCTPEYRRSYVIPSQFGHSILPLQASDWADMAETSDFGLEGCASDVLKTECLWVSEGIITLHPINR